MNRTVLLCACVVATFIACGDKRPPKSPEAAVEEPTSEEPDVKKASSTPEAPASPGNTTAPVPSAESKPTCASLQKSVCKVTAGCAWYEHQGKGKCIDEGSTP